MTTLETTGRKEGCCGLCGEKWQPQNYGSPRRCAFEGETFGDNWTCGLVDRIRREMYDRSHEDHALRYRNEGGVGSVGALVVEVPGTDPSFPFRDHLLTGLLVATWYKNRAATDTMEWAVLERDIPCEQKRTLTREQAVLIVNHLNEKELAES